MALSKATCSQMIYDLFGASLREQSPKQRTLFRGNMINFFSLHVLFSAGWNQEGNTLWWNIVIAQMKRLNFVGYNEWNNWIIVGKIWFFFSCDGRPTSTYQAFVFLFHFHFFSEGTCVFQLSDFMSDGMSFATSGNLLQTERINVAIFWGYKKRPRT